MHVGIFICLFKEITLATVFIMFCFPDSGRDGFVWNILCIALKLLLQQVYYVLDINYAMDFLFVSVVQAEQSFFDSFLKCFLKSYTMTCSYFLPDCSHMYSDNSTFVDRKSVV